MQIVLGVIAGFGQAPYDQPIVTVIALAMGLCLVHQRNGRSKIFAAWALGLGYFAHVMVWITEPFMVDAAATGWMAGPALFLMAGGLALFWAAAGAVGRGMLGLIFAFAVAEIARSFVLSGLPWALVGYIWIDSWGYQLAAIIGPHGMTALTFALAGLMATLRWPALIGAFGAVALWLIPMPAPQGVAQDAPVVRIVHPNILQHEKWHPDTRGQMYQRQLELTAQPGDLDLIVWPESALTYPLQDARPDIIRAGGGVPVLLGHQSNPDFQIHHNTASLLSGGEDASLDQMYVKTRLVPFGEYIPLGWLVARLGISGLADVEGQGFQPGTGAQLMHANGIGPILPIICYEGIFPHFVGSVSDRARAIILITNDAWFGTWGGPAQHFAQSRARATEQGIPVIRSANRGVSAMIDAKGNVLVSKGLKAEGVIDAKLPDVLEMTPYARSGDWPSVLFIFLGLVASFGFSPRRIG